MRVPSGKCNHHNRFGMSLEWLTNWHTCYCAGIELSYRSMLTPVGSRLAIPPPHSQNFWPANT